MTDLEIQGTFKRIQRSGTTIPENLNRLYKGLRSWHKKTGGLSELQVKLLRDIEYQIKHT